MMRQHPEVLETLATEIVAESRLKPPIDAYALCDLAGLEVRVGRPGSRPTVVGDTILVPPEDPTERQRFAAAHELVHLCLRARGIPDSEWTVNYVTSAVLHPRDWFLGVLARRGWDFDALRKECPWSSFEALGRRIVHVRHAVLWICDRTPTGDKSFRWRSRGAAPKLERPTSIEREIVRRAATDLEPQKTVMVSAWPLFNRERNVLRVVSIANAVQLARAA